MSAGSVEMSGPVSLMAPIAGWAMPLEEVPDPVFAERMMGDGVAIEPLEGTLRAPCDAEVISVADTGHSVTLRLANGAELLIHIGLETVALNGEGFSPQVDMGDRVRLGDELIRFDMDSVARGAASLVTPIVVASPNYTVTVVASNQQVDGNTPLLEVRQGEASEEQNEGNGDTVEGHTTIPMAHGLHARPAARLAAALKPFKADVRLFAYSREANARSTVALLTLGLRQGDEVNIRASGPDAAAALDVVKTMIHSGLGEGGVSAPSSGAMEPSEAATPAQTSIFTGVCAAPGFAIGPIVKLRVTELTVTEQGGEVQSELAMLDKARAEVGAELGEAHSAESRDIGDAHRSLLEDPDLLDSARAMISSGKSAGYAWRSAIRTQTNAIRSTGNARLVERADDLLDIERRVLEKLQGGEIEKQEISPGALLVADNLLPSQFMALKHDDVRGIVTAFGGPTSHVAILAASAGIPMLVAVGEGLLSVTDGGAAILDSQRGSFDAAPSEDAVTAAKARIKQQESARAAIALASAQDCVMADGTRIDVFANVASIEDAERALSMGAEGCGLLRTEFLFLDRSEAPSEEEQRDVYGKIAAALNGRPLIVRTLDIGGDKPVPYIPFPHEDNPALGRRGVRLSLFRPELLASQLRAVLAAVPANQCRIMVPMIVDIEELRAVRTIFNEAAKAVGVTAKIPLGIMVETPSAALLADSLSQEADFLSVGTNDLSQYTLAVDRGNEAVAAKVDALHPAVLRLIAEAGRGAAANGRWLGVCGGLASDPAAAAILIGLGATELSAVPAAVSQVKASVRKLTMEHCRTIAQKALAASTVGEVRTILEGQG